MALITTDWAGNYPLSINEYMMMTADRHNRLLLITLFLLLFAGKLPAQSLNPMPVPVWSNGQLLPNALAGGLNNPQLSEADLNLDGFMDLVIFDRKGDVLLTFLHTATAGSSEYLYAPEYTRHFPKINGWMMLRDFNGDEIPDIFAYSDVPGIDGIIVYRGSYNAQNELTFQKIPFNNPHKLIYFPLPNGSQTQLYVTKIDYPDVVDVDGDGDLDILTFGVAGGYLEYYANRSVEMGFGTDTLIYRLASTCWGGFYESGFTEAVDLSASSGQCYSPLHDNPGQLETRHAGSTILAFDADGDGDKDLILGDISFNNLNFLRNGGTPQTAWMTAQDNDFPSYNIPLDLPVFPAAFLLDLDHDGRKDLAVAPNATNISEDREVLWRYRNVQQNPVQFELVERNFLVNTMIDLGTGANPAFADVNGDGLTDLVIGNGSYYQPSGLKASRLYLYLNTGTASQPAFSLTDTNWLNMALHASATFNLAPAFGDLDNDGDLDLLVGEDFGLLFFFENTAGPGNPPQFAAPVYPYMNIDVGLASTPHIADLNRDGFMDLLIGERNGNINYFPNQATGPGPASFNSAEAAPNIPQLGRVDARIPGFTAGYSAPVIVDINNQFTLFTGTEIGRIEAYTVTEDNFAATFPLISETWENLQSGARSRLAFADLNNDGLLEMAVGNERGGLQIFGTSLPAQLSSASRDTPKDSPGPKVWPNPASHTLWFSLPESGQQPAAIQCRLYTSDGRLIRQRVHTGNQWSENLSGLPEGLYFWQLELPQGSISGKFILKQ
jgi:hypothetical protein